MVDVYSQQWLLPRYGMYAMDYANVWPDLTAQLLQLYRDKLGVLPWLPSDWRQSITALHGQEGKLLVPAPSNATAPDGSRIKFLDTPEKREVWDTIVNEINEVKQNYINNERERGLYMLRMLYQQSAFWTNAHKIAQFAALPVNVVTEVVDTYDKYKKTTHAVLVLGGILAIYFYFKR